MNEYIFPLVRPLAIPSRNVPGALLVFLPTKHGLTYKVSPFPRDQRLHVTLEVVTLENNVVVYPLSEFDITETGFPSGVALNQDAIDSYLAEYAPLVAASDAKYAEMGANEDAQVAELANTGQVSQKLIDAYTVLLGEFQELQDQIGALGQQPVPVYEYINKYSEVKDYFDNTMTITPEGLVWAKTIPFLGNTLGDFIG